MKQKSFFTVDNSRFKKDTRRENFLKQMDSIIPWKEIIQIIEPYYSPGKSGRKPKDMETMLRIYFLQHWFNLSDPGAEEAIYDSYSMRQFSNIDLDSEPAPDETTILNFRHLIEKNNLAETIFNRINRYLQEKGVKIETGTIVDATIIAAPSSTKNKTHERDPEMKQTKKGNQWYFGMKLHIGIDSKSQIIHSMVTTSANVHDSQMIGHLLHGDEKRIYGDSAYISQKEKIHSVAPFAKDFTNKRSFRKKELSEKEKMKNHNKSSIRCRVEYPFLVMKHLWGFRKVRYKGLAKNTSWLFIMAGLANLYLKRNKLSPV